MNVFNDCCKFGTDNVIVADKEGFSFAILFIFPANLNSIPFKSIIPVRGISFGLSNRF